MYTEWKDRWLRENPGLSRTEARARMNETLCEEVAEANRLARSRTPAAALARTRDERRRRARERAGASRPGRFFAKKEAPAGWSLNAHLSGMEFPFEFEHVARAGGRRLRETMSKDTVERLRPTQWFTSDIINAYMTLLGTEGNPGSATSIFMPSFFFTRFTVTERNLLGSGVPDLRYVGKPAGKRHELVKRWTRNLDTTKPIKIFVPVNVGNSHWFMIMIDVKNKKVVSMDSLRSSSGRADERNEMLGWIEAEHASKQKPFRLEEWSSVQKNVPKQRNGYDCGPFSCMFAAFMSNDKRMSFLQGDLPKMRKRIAWSILHNEL